VLPGECVESRGSSACSLTVGNIEGIALIAQSFAALNAGFETSRGRARLDELPWSCWRCRYRLCRRSMRDDRHPEFGLKCVRRRPRAACLRRSRPLWRIGRSLRMAVCVADGAFLLRSARGAKSEWRHARRREDVLLDLVVALLARQLDQLCARRKEPADVGRAPSLAGGARAALEQLRIDRTG
jgi:hypothetical protein